MTPQNKKLLYWALGIVAAGGLSYAVYARTKKKKDDTHVPASAPGGKTNVDAGTAQVNTANLNSLLVHQPVKTPGDILHSEKENFCCG